MSCALRCWLVQNLLLATPLLKEKKRIANCIPFKSTVPRWKETHHCFCCQIGAVHHLCNQDNHCIFPTNISLTNFLCSLHTMLCTAQGSLDTQSILHTCPIRILWTKVWNSWSTMACRVQVLGWVLGPMLGLALGL